MTQQSFSGICDLKKFKQWQKQHPNFMTPHILKLINIKNIIIELSEGTDFSNLPIYGITIFVMYGDKYENQNHPYTTYNQMVRGYETAQWKIERITEIIKKDCGIQ